MRSNSNPKYFKSEDEINTYIKDEDDFLDTRILRDVVKEEVIKEKKVVSKVATRGLDEEPIEALERETPNVIGSLFDRIEFLKQRIEETNSALDLRKTINKEITSDIQVDIKEKEEIERRLVDIDDKRNFRMDISMLRKEMRAEKVRFWKDILELRTELRELLEQYQTESKIVGIFKGIEMDGLR
ncbi:MAG: hypothetical protein NTY20_04200 [Candidatus Aenigmarchaeota archaeon]|nr:hypothetical protein [Candidatus Aenigmarchaeota archaeon]